MRCTPRGCSRISALQTLLAYGIVLVVTEEATLETKRAHLELEAAHEALRHAAFRDQMSGALNRHAFDEGIGLEQLGGGRGAVAVLDVDHLKPLNDSMGHAAGDALLRHVATALTRPPASPGRSELARKSVGRRATRCVQRSHNSVPCLARSEWPPEVAPPTSVVVKSGLRRTAPPSLSRQPDGESDIA